MDSWTDFELQHEMDSPIVTDTEPLTFANTGYVLHTEIIVLFTTSAKNREKKKY